MNLTRIGGALLAIALPFMVTGVAHASDDTSLTLSVSVPEGETQEVVLECDPPGGTHPKAMFACVELLRSDGDFDALADHQFPMSCTLEYRPVVAAATGTWHGEPVEWTREYSNPCMLSSETGAVFRF
ncbi:SSI family serine proteinase inhibitor [Actinophytocola glycyrrhizae]|uniref:SSI family serine proteinase inhibitor n=1 Tax=Actinophytocola glycyrrhizae TaxID=2044873 RepID=A0ABV9S3V5_9PSEU